MWKVPGNMSEGNEDTPNQTADEKIDGLVWSMKLVCETIGSFDQRLEYLEHGDGSSGASLRFGPGDHELYSQPRGPHSERGDSQHLDFHGVMLAYEQLCNLDNLDKKLTFLSDKVRDKKGRPKNM